MNLDNSLVVGALAVLLGRGLDYAHTTRLIVPAATLIALGFQTAFFSFFIDIRGLHRK